MRTKSVRMSRRWAPLAGAVVVVALVAGGSAVVLVQEDEEAPRPRVVAALPKPEPDPAPSPSIGSRAVDLNPDRRTPGAAPVTTHAPLPRRVRDVVAADSPPVELAAWVKDRSLEPTVRYTALRQLEQTAPAAAVGAAIACLDDITQLVRLNAIAVLARSDDPRAKEALSRIDDRSQRLAQALVARR